MYIHRYKTALILFLMSFSTLSIGQNISFDKIEQEMKKNAIDGKVDKLLVDLNGDGKADIIYFYAFSELSCLQVYLQVNGLYIKVIDEVCSNYALKPYQTGIATIKGGARLKVLSELQTKDRTWLYVEAEESAIKDKCYITDFDSNSSFRDHQHPSIRGWVSSRYIEKEHIKPSERT